MWMKSFSAMHLLYPTLRRKSWPQRCRRFVVTQLTIVPTLRLRWTFRCWEPNRPHDRAHVSVKGNPPQVSWRSVQDRTKEPWFQLCQLAAVERDPAKMLMLVQEICRLLKEKETLLRRTLKREEERT